MSLRSLLTLPYVALVVALAAVVGWLSYRAADRSVDDLTSRLASEITQRVSDTTQAYLNNWQYVLAAAAVDRWDSQAPQALARAEHDLWHGSAVSTVRPSYVYLATADKRFVGVQRPLAGPVLLKWREASEQPQRELFEIARPGDRKRSLGLEPNAYDATQRPWFARAAQSQQAVWSPVYLDHASHQPMVTLARAYRFPSGPKAGELSHVVGADVPLAYLQTFLQGLNIVPGGVAFVVTRDGKLVASSQAEHALPSDAKALPEVASHWDALVAQSAQALGARLQQDRRGLSASFENHQNGRVLVTALPMKAEAGMDWWVVVSLPDDALMANARHNAYRTVALALLACVVAVGIGAWVLNHLAGDIGRLTHAAEHLSLDETPEPLRLSHSGELGRLASAFNRMAVRLSASTQKVLKQNTDLERSLRDLELQTRAREGADTRLRRIADSLQEGLIVLDRDWRISFANKRSERFFPLKHDQLLGMDVREVYLELEHSAFGQALAKAWLSRHMVAVEAPALTLPGVWIGLRLFPTPFGVAAFLSDVTDQREAREALADRERQLSELAAELLCTQSEERRSIARELHDEFGQSLGALRISLQTTAATLPAESSQQRALRDALEQTTTLLNQVRNRSLDLHPVVLDDLGLVPALQWWCERQTGRSAVPIELDVPPNMGRLGTATELACFRVVQEAVSNALKHARPSRVTVRLRRHVSFSMPTLDTEDLRIDTLRVEVLDDGQGWADVAGQTFKVTVPQSLGLISMRERAQQLGGSLTITSAPPRGTAVRLTLPWDPAVETTSAELAFATPAAV
jgi:PAS domain S-box-containing protein